MDGKTLTKEDLRRVFLEPCYSIDKSGNGLKVCTNQIPLVYYHGLSDGLHNFEIADRSRFPFVKDRLQWLLEKDFKMSLDEGDYGDIFYDYNGILFDDKSYETASLLCKDLQEETDSLKEDLTNAEYDLETTGNRGYEAASIRKNINELKNEIRDNEAKLNAYKPDLHYYKQKAKEFER
jgi:DNA repair ATPase RecN